jgi:hypothetical protein
MSTAVSETVTQNSGQPDIQYHPDLPMFQARTASRLAEDPSLPSRPLPEGLPARVDGPIV